MKIVTLFTIQDLLDPNGRLQAQLLKSELEESGIPTYLEEENFSMLRPHCASLKVKVHEEDLEKAIEIAKKMQDEGNLPK